MCVHEYTCKFSSASTSCVEQSCIGKTKMCVICASYKELQSPFRLWGEEKLSVKSTGILLAIILVQSVNDFDQRVNNSYLNFTPNQKIDSLH